MARQKGHAVPTTSGFVSSSSSVRMMFTRFSGGHLHPHVAAAAAAAEPALARARRIDHASGPAPPWPPRAAPP